METGTEIDFDMFDRPEPDPKEQKKYDRRKQDGIFTKLIKGKLVLYQAKKKEIK